MEYLRNFKTNLARVVIANEKATDKMASGLLYKKKKLRYPKQKGCVLTKIGMGNHLNYILCILDFFLHLVLLALKLTWG